MKGFGVLLILVSPPLLVAIKHALVLSNYIEELIKKISKV